MKTIQCFFYRFLAAPLGLFSLLLTLLPGTLNAQTTTIYSDLFDGGATALNTTAPNIRPGSETWNANLIANENGALVATGDGSALLPVSLETNKIYTLSIDATLTSGFYLFLGFCQTNITSPGANLTADRFNQAARGTFPTMAMLYQTGHNTVQAADKYNEILGSTTAYDTAVNHNYKMVLNTTGDGSSATATYYVDNVAFVTDGLVNYAAMSTIKYVGFSIRSTGGTIDNFRLTGVSIEATNIVTYDGNGSDGGTVPVDAINPYTNGATVTVLGNTGILTKSGFAFNGWNTAADGSGTAYTAGNTFAIAAGGLTLYARWAAPTATITAPATFPTAISALAGTASSSTSVAVSGSGLTGNITATAPSSNLEVSSDNVTFGSTATFTQSGGSASGTLYVRLAASAPLGSYNSQNVILTSPGASPVNVATTASGNSVVDTAVWTSTTTPATWGTPGNWLNNVVGTNVNNTADFNQVNITADTTVNLTTPLTIGKLIFGDTATGTAAGWTVANNSTPANILTLAGTTPTVTVNTLGAGKSAVISTVVAGTSGLIKAGAGTLVLSDANTYSGATTVSNGTLTLSGNRTADIGAITVGQDANLATLNIQAGSFSFGANGLNVGTGTVGGITNGIVNQTGGNISFTNTFAVLVGGAGTAGNSGVYKLSGGSITGFASGTRGVLLGVNADSTGIFELSSSGNLNLPAGFLGIGRSDSTSAPHNTRGVFYQTGGTAIVNTMSMGSRSPGTNGNATLTLIGGTFTNQGITRFCQGTNDVATITIGGTADVTMARFPTARGDGAVTTITFDGGTFRPYASSLTYMTNLTHAYLTENGANFNLASGIDITIDQVLENAPTKTGVLTKAGPGTLTLSGANTYSGGTVVSNGTLVVTGSLGTGAATVQPSGTLALGATVATLTMSSNLTLQGTVVMKIANDSNVLTRDQVAGINTVTYGGTLIVTNIGGSPLQVGDSFQLFAASSRVSSFANIVYPAGYTFTNNLATSGTITVLTVSPVGSPTLSFTPSGGNWVFNWSGSGFKLQTQTNTLSVGLSTNWVDVVGGGTSGVSVPAPVSGNPTVFFRLISTP